MSLPPLMPTPPSIHRAGLPEASGWPATRVLAQRALRIRPLADPWRPSDVELDRIDWALDSLGATRLELLQTTTPGIELVAVGRWTLDPVRSALAHFADAPTLAALETLRSHAPVGDVVRVVGAVDGRTDRTTFQLGSELATTPSESHLAELKSLCTALGIPTESIHWLSSVHHNLTRHTARACLLQLDVVHDSVRPWLIMRYPQCPLEAVQAIWASLGPAVPRLDTPLPSTPLTLEVRVADRGAPRLGLETRSR